MCWRLVVTVKSVGDADFTLSLASIALISMLELWLGIICASMPTLSPLMNTYVTPTIRILVSKYSSSKRSKQSTSSQEQQIGRPRTAGNRRVRDKWSVFNSLFNSMGGEDETTTHRASYFGAHRIPEAEITGTAFYSGSEHELIGAPTENPPQSINAVTNFWQEVETMDQPVVQVPKVTHNWD